MTLRSTIQDLRAHADVANDEHQVQVRTGQFADLSARLGPPLAELPSLNVGLAEIAQLDVEMPPGHDQDAAQVVESLRALANEIPTLGIDENLDLAKARVRSAEKYVSELRALVTSAWQSFVNQPPPAINSDLVDALAHGGVDVEEIRDALETARGHLLAISSRMVPDQGAVKRFRAAIAAIHRCGEKLGEVVDADIAEGIVGSQEPSGMPLTWFTPERLEKLADLDIIDRFQVHLR
jgi:alkylhydroperoxidase family enzyme